MSELIVEANCHKTNVPGICASCRFYHHTNGPYEGACHRHSPAIRHAANGTTAGKAIAVWPPVTYEDSCGDWECGPRKNK